MKVILNSIFQKYYGYFFFIILCFSLFIGFFFNEDASGGGTSNDFFLTWAYVEELKKSIFLIPSKWTVHFPLHYILLAKLNIFISNKDVLRFCFTCISVLIPLVFYKCLKIKFKKINLNLLLVLSSVIFLIPAFRYSAIWANAQNTSFIFFLISIYFFFKWEEKKINFIDINIIFQLISFFLAVYSRQYFIFFIFYFLFIYLLRLNWKNNLILYFIIFIFSIPAIILILLNSTYFTGTGLSFKLYNSFLVNFSILSFYLIPIFFINSFDPKKFSEVKKNLLYIPIFIFVIIILTFFFDYNYYLGGGFFLKLSRILFNNNFLFYISSLLGLFFLYNMAKENNANFISIVLLIFCFSGSFVYQKYYEPLFFIFFFLLFKTQYYEIFFSKLKAILGLLLYFFIYLLFCIINNFYQITKNIT
jgi:hypothetical protein